MRAILRAIGRTVLCAILFFGGCANVSGGLETLSRWAAIGPAFAAYAVFWCVAGAAVIVSAIWILLSRGRNKYAFWIAGGAVAGSSASSIVGTLTYVIPCAGPS